MKLNQVGNTNQLDSGYKPTQAIPKEAVEQGVQRVKEQKESIQVEEDKKVLDEEIINKSVKQANKALERVERHIHREVHEVTHAVMYKLKDNSTGEVIAEFPPKKIQDMIAKMWELAGLFVDEKA